MDESADGTSQAPGSVGRVVIVSGSVGAGHDGVAHELADRLGSLGHDVEVVDLLVGFPFIAGVLLGSAYVLTLRVAPWLYGATCWLVERSRQFQRLADLVCCSASPWLLRQVEDADLVVATYPPAARALGRLRERGLLHVPAVTYLTDPAPNFLWVHRAVDLHLTMSRATAEQAQQAYGVPVEPAGPLVDARFRTTDRAGDSAHLREVVGAGPGVPVGLVLLGSLGVGQALAAGQVLAKVGVVPVVLCGRNAALLRRIRSVPEIVALGWRDDAARLVCGADLVVHNAGGLALTEALVAGVPAVTFAPLAGHGRANARTLDRSGLVPWAHTREQLADLVVAALAAHRAPWPQDDETAVARICALLAPARPRAA